MKLDLEKIYIFDFNYKYESREFLEPILERFFNLYDYNPTQIAKVLESVIYEENKVRALKAVKETTLSSQDIINLKFPDFTEKEEREINFLTQTLEN